MYCDDAGLDELRLVSPGVHEAKGDEEDFGAGAAPERSAVELGRFEPAGLELTLPGEGDAAVDAAILAAGVGIGTTVSVGRSPAGPQTNHARENIEQDILCRIYFTGYLAQDSMRRISCARYLEQDILRKISCT